MLDIRKNSFTERMAKHWKKEAAHRGGRVISLEEFNRYLDVV